jgi:hypothetical protein
LFGHFVWQAPEFRSLSAFNQPRTTPSPDHPVPASNHPAPCRRGPSFSHRASLLRLAHCRHDPASQFSFGRFPESPASWSFSSAPTIIHKTLSCYGAGPTDQDAEHRSARVARRTPAQLARRVVHALAGVVLPTTAARVMSMTMEGEYPGAVTIRRSAPVPAHRCRATTRRRRQVHRHRHGVRPRPGLSIVWNRPATPRMPATLHGSDPDVQPPTGRRRVTRPTTTLMGHRVRQASIAIRTSHGVCACYERFTAPPTGRFGTLPKTPVPATLSALARQAGPSENTSPMIGPDGVSRWRTRPTQAI